MRVYPFFLLILLSLFLSQAAHSGPADQVRAAPAIDIMKSATSQMESQINSIPESSRKKVAKLVAKQKSELATAEQKCGGQQLVTRRELDICLAPAFKTGSELISTLTTVEANGIQSKAYSPDPSYCANECHRMCGYDSVGDKVCWYSCYYHCGHGG